jgi:hypothetical protein
VDDILIAVSSCFVSDMLSLEVVDMFLHAKWPYIFLKIPAYCLLLCDKSLLC